MRFNGSTSRPESSPERLKDSELASGSGYIPAWIGANTILEGEADGKGGVQKIHTIVCLRWWSGHRSEKKPMAKS
jgi:hypothetical protein